MHLCFTPIPRLGAKKAMPPTGWERQVGGVGIYFLVRYIQKREPD